MTNGHQDLSNDQRGDHAQRRVEDRSGDRDRQRSEKLDRHRDPKRDPGDRLVEAEVHPGDHQSEEHDRPPLRRQQP
jgi:hypothetical protein